MRAPSQRTPLPGPTFIRLLARLTDVEVPPSPHGLPERLSQWLDWNRAVALSRALDASPASPVAATSDPQAEAAEAARLRGALTRAIVDMPELAATCADIEEPRPAPPDYALFHKRYLARQQAMLAATGMLRGRLREQLATRSPALARLAEIDAVMELTLGPREHTLLAAVPTLLGEHFQRLRQAALSARGEAALAGQAPPACNAWLDLFGHDMQQLLLAELDVRFHPIDALLAALPPPPTGTS